MDFESLFLLSGKKKYLPGIIIMITYEKFPGRKSKMHPLCPDLLNNTYLENFNNCYAAFCVVEV